MVDAEPSRSTPADVSWVVDISIANAVEVPGLGLVDRGSFLEWVWQALGDEGLVGIVEGEVSVEEAARLGLAPTSLVIDAAAAPPDRDWVAGLPSAVASCWFGGEAAARAAATVLASATGCDVRGIRSAEPDSADSWRDAFSKVSVPGFGVVCPSWDEGIAGGGAGTTTVFIEPGVGFGTGLHATTQLCLMAIAEWSRRGGALGRVLDFGCGSGILGIAAAVLGAARVEAVEVDERVHAAIHANADRNGVAHRVTVAAALPVSGEPYDLVVANIVGEVLLAHADELTRLVRRDDGAAPHGCLVLSGLRAEGVPRVAARFSDLLGMPPHEHVADGWYALTFARMA